MNKITVSVSVSIYGDDFDLNKVIKRFKVLSTETRIKGVIPKRSQRESVQTSWTKSTGQYSLDINNQLDQIITSLQPEKETLLKISDDFQVNFVFTILINIKNNDKPAIYFKTKPQIIIFKINAQNITN